MATRERATHRGRQRGLGLAASIGSEIRLARRSLGLGLGRVAHAVGISASELSRIERGLAPWVSIVVLAQLCAVVGLELSARAYPGARPLRDDRHARLLTHFRGRLHASLRWATEVALPFAGDQRAFDALISGQGWRFVVEAELNPIDGQALIRRLMLKQRDGAVDGLILLLPDSRATRLFRADFAALLATDFPVGTSAALRALGKGHAPPGNAIVVLR